METFLRALLGIFGLALACLVLAVPLLVYWGFGWIVLFAANMFFGAGLPITPGTTILAGAVLLIARIVLGRGLVKLED